MAYDKKTGTISTNGDRREFEKDMFAHFKHVEAQVDAELAKKANETKSITLQERIKISEPPHQDINDLIRGMDTICVLSHVELSRVTRHGLSTMG